MIFEINSKKVCIQRSYGNISSLPSLDAEDLSYSYFLDNFMAKNLPCVIRNITKNWKTNQNWLKNDKPNLEYLENNYGHTNVMIYNCSERYYNSQSNEVSTFSKYIDYWKNQRNDNSIYYLKDWHLKLQCRNDMFYNVPLYFSSDWLNEYFTECLDDDYRFVYMGPKGSWTPFHSDVFSSYSWSVNICGKKRWIFIHPGEENNFKDHLDNVPYDVNEIENFKNYIELFQNPGEAIFVPSGWYHQVWNVEDTISVNHNWINGCNIDIVWSSLKQNFENVKAEIDDCKDMENFQDHCQTMLKSIFGMNHKTFYELLKYIVKNRIIMLSNEPKRTLYHGHTIGTNHILFDLEKCKDVLVDFLKCDHVNTNKIDYDVESLLAQIEITVENKL